MNSKFNPGDKVICIDVHFKAVITYGKSYKVIRNYIGNTIVINNDDGNEDTYYANRFVLDPLYVRDKIIDDILD